MIYSKYPLKVLQEVEPFPPIQNTDNPYLTEAAMHADQVNQLEGYIYKVTDKGHFEYLGTTLGDLRDYRSIRDGKNIILRSNNTSSSLKFLDSLTTDTVGFFMRYDAANNFFEIGSNDGASGDVIVAKIDRGKTDWEFQDRIQILAPGRGINFLTPSATDLDGNAFAKKYELRVNEGGVIELWTINGFRSLDALVWSSENVTAKKASLTFDLSNLGSYADDAAANTGGVAIGFAYINSSTGAMHRRLT